MCENFNAHVDSLELIFSTIKDWKFSNLNLRFIESFESNLLDYTVAAAFIFGGAFDTTADLVINERTLKVKIV